MSDVEDFLKGFLNQKINLKTDLLKKVSINIDNNYNYGCSAGIFLIKYLNYDFHKIPNFEQRLSLMQMEYNVYKKVLSDGAFKIFINQFDFDKMISSVDQDIQNIIKNDPYNKIFPLEKINQIDLEKQASIALQDNHIKILLDKNYADLLLFLKLIYYSRLDIVFSINKKA